MTIAEIIQPGDKVDISFVQNVERAKKDQSMPKIYKSQVLDLKENGNLEISMPVERGKLVLLPLGIRMEFIFFSKGTLYRAVGQVRERYKRENVYMLEIELKSQISKYQRREFFRFPCIMDMNYYTIEEQEAALKTGEALFIELQEAEGKSRDREFARSRHITSAAPATRLHGICIISTSFSGKVGFSFKNPGSKSIISDCISAFNMLS